MQRRLLVTGGSGFIGTNLIEWAASHPRYQVKNLDQNEPLDHAQTRYFTHCNLLDRSALTEQLRGFKPTDIVHLAGRTDMLGESLDDYASNHVGTENLLHAILEVGTVERAIFTSSQFVVGPGTPPQHDLDFRPHTIYGESKVLSEKAVRANNLPYIWTIVRPTNIWGKWHPRYPREFWRVLQQGRYLHPSGRPVVRCYGYVGNVVEQLMTILERPADVVNGKVFYVGDAPIELADWVNAFSLELTGRQVREVPWGVLSLIARFGDFVLSCGGKFPLFSSRLRSMTEDYVTPMEPTFAALGNPSITMDEGVRTTVKWLRSSQINGKTRASKK
nr:NAD(P)-dependent oxidoreductase [Granulicella sp. dw_53]